MEWNVYTEGGGERDASIFRNDGRPDYRPSLHASISDDRSTTPLWKRQPETWRPFVSGLDGINSLSLSLFPSRYLQLGRPAKRSCPTRELRRLRIGGALYLPPRIVCPPPIQFNADFTPL